MAHDKMAKSPFNRGRYVLCDHALLARIILSTLTALTSHHSRLRDHHQRLRTYDLNTSITLHMLCCDKVLSVIIFCNFHSKNMKLKTKFKYVFFGIEK